MDAAELKRLLGCLPHGEPFRFVDALLEFEAGVRGRGVWLVRGDEAFFRGHFPPPGERIVPGVLIGEALAQVAGLVAFAGGATMASARLAQIDVKILAPVRPPARIELAATLVRDMGRLALLEVAATVDGHGVVGGRVVLARDE